MEGGGKGMGKEVRVGDVGSFGELVGEVGFLFLIFFLNFFFLCLMIIIFY